MNTSTARMQLEELHTPRSMKVSRGDPLIDNLFISFCSVELTRRRIMGKGKPDLVQSKEVVMQLLLVKLGERGAVEVLDRSITK